MAVAIMTIKTDELVLGDAVRLLSSPYGWGTVVNVTDEEVHIFRPYVHIDDVEYTGGVLHYIGTSTVKVWRQDSREFEVDAFTHERMTKPGALR
jgi:hypothetical protein